MAEIARSQVAISVMDVDHIDTYPAAAVVNFKCSSGTKREQYTSYAADLASLQTQYAGLGLTVNHRDLQQHAIALPPSVADAKTQVLTWAWPLLFVP